MTTTTTPQKRRQAAAAWAQVYRTPDSKDIATRAFIAGCMWQESQLEIHRILGNQQNH